MKKLVVVQYELKAAKERRNLVAQCIENIQNSDLLVEIRIGANFSRILGEPTHIIEHHHSNDNLRKIIFQHFLEQDKKELTQIMEHIAKLEQEEKDILHSLCQNGKDDV